MTDRLTDWLTEFNRCTENIIRLELSGQLDLCQSLVPTATL